MQKRMGTLNRGGARATHLQMRGFALLVLCAAGLLSATPAAKATFHEMSIREVYPGGADNASYVELQMWAAGQNAVAGRHLVAYNSNGSVNENFSFGSGVAHGNNQDTILVADSSYASVFPGKPAPDATDAGLNLDPSGGAVCWVEGSPPDCVAWGGFTGPLPSHVPTLVVGSPASPGGVTAGKALLRSIAAGCSTLLELGDDTDSSVADFSEQPPNPRDNATTPTESVCPNLPNTFIDTKPPLRTNNTTASFTFHAVPATGASFQCNLDEAGFVACPASYTDLVEGSHDFEVRAMNGAGADPSPAGYSWTIDLTPPDAIIDSQPSDGSPGVSVSFTFHSTELNSTFQCKLDAVVKPCTASGAVLKNLSDGLHTFEVRATDPAGNESTPGPFPGGTYTWTVDNSSVDVAPPNTFIDTRPPDPSSSRTVSFSYHADEAATFECKLDAAPFAACSVGGITYTGLPDGPHTFQVRAIDTSSNVDLTPAGYSFAVVLPGSSPSGSAGSQSRPPAQSRTAPPQTVLRLKPPPRTHDRTPSFRFSSSVAGATFQCKVDRGRFKTCSSPFTTKRLGFGRHTIEVRAIHGGAADPTPATFGFKVVKRR